MPVCMYMNKPSGECTCATISRWLPAVCSATVLVCWCKSRVLAALFFEARTRSSGCMLELHLVHICNEGNPKCRCCELSQEFDRHQHVLARRNMECICMNDTIDLLERGRWPRCLQQQVQVSYHSASYRELQSLAII